MVWGFYTCVRQKTANKNADEIHHFACDMCAYDAFILVFRRKFMRNEMRIIRTMTP